METFNNETAKASSKQLRINNMRAYFDSSTLSSTNTFATPASDDAPTKDGWTSPPYWKKSRLEKGEGKS